MTDIPHYLSVITEAVSADFPDARVIAPCQVFGRPGLIGVIVVFPIEDGGVDIESDTDQKVSFVLSESDLGDDAKLSKLAAMALDCRKHLVRSDFVVRGEDKLTVRQRVEKALRLPNSDKFSAVKVDGVTITSSGGADAVAG